MDLETISADDFGASLRGLGLNLLVRDIDKELAFLDSVFRMKAHRVSKDFAILRYQDQIFQLHADSTYHSNPLVSLIPENPPRGGGIELRLFETDPDIAAKRAADHGHIVLQDPTPKPHGLLETYILSPDGYAWVASRPLTTHEKSQTS